MKKFPASISLARIIIRLYERNKKEIKIKEYYNEKNRVFLMVLVLFFSLTFSVIAVGNISSSTTLAKHSYTPGELAGEFNSERSLNKITEGVHVSLATRSTTSYYITYLSNGDMLTNLSYSLDYSRFVLTNHNIANNLRRWNFILVTGSDNKYLIQSVNNTNLYLTANPTTRVVSLNSLNNSGVDSNQHWQMYIGGPNGNGLMSASTNTNITGYKLSGLNTLVNTNSYSSIGFIDCSWFVPATLANLSAEPLAVNQSRYMYPIVTPSNANCVGSNYWNHSSNDHEIFTVNNNLITGVNGGTATYTITHKVTGIIASCTINVYNTMYTTSINSNQVTFSTLVSSTPIWPDRTAAIDDSVRLFDKWPAFQESKYYFSWSTANEFKTNEINATLAASEALARPGLNTVFYTTSEIGHGISESTDWGRSIGSYTTGIKCTVSVTGTNTYNATIIYSLHDYYDWNPLMTSMGNLPVSPKDMWELHHGGLGKNYEISGTNTITITWSKGQRLGTGANKISDI
ncbi:MAG: hypothetical protein VB118_02185 [Oscillospiraceae bacterium]|nr:hypothetical protein [Oscillospiraceae bacterium]